MSEITFKTKIYAPGIEPHIRHPRILAAFDNLVSGEVMELTNDHDPRPLHYQFLVEKESLFAWDYLDQRGTRPMESSYQPAIDSDRQDSSVSDETVFFCEIFLQVKYITAKCYRNR